MSNKTKKLFTPIELGLKKSSSSTTKKSNLLKLNHRVVLAPLTRSRAFTGNCEPNEHYAAIYYSQRATEGGLLITEASQINPQGQGYPFTPGIFTKEQIEGWKKITEAVHKKGGLIFLQLWHVGRARWKNSVGPSDIGIVNFQMTDLDNLSKGMNNVVPEKPKALTKEEIKQVIKDYAQAARNAKEAGFDGVELHGANGYLVDQFIEDGSNKRTDEYGGSIQNRLRFLNETVESIIDGFGGTSERVGVRLSPEGRYLDMSDSTPKETFREAVKSLNKFDLAYLHLMEPRSKESDPIIVTKELRPYFDGPLLSCGSYNRETAIQIVEDGYADMVAFGRYYISNPDLVYRLQNNLPLTQPNYETFYYSPDVKTGYIDYKTYQEQQ
ncbi:hypothetical protein ABK040_011683 [Willaertia magna]